MKAGIVVRKAMAETANQNSKRSDEFIGDDLSLKKILIIEIIKMSKYPVSMKIWIPSTMLLF